MLQVAIIGCGVIGPVHAAAVGLDAGAAVRWACDRDLARARGRVAARFAGADAAEALADPAVDLVCVCTPHPTHADLACAALAAGKHVLCEKPLASSPADLARMLAAAAARPDRIAAGVFQHRHAPLARRLRRLVADGGFGRIRAVRVRFACTRDAAYYAADAWRGTRAGEGGGVALNQAIHTIDLALWIAGVRARQVSTTACRRRLACIEVEDLLACAIAGDEAGGDPVGVEVVAENDGTTPWSQAISIVGDRGGVELGDDHRLLRVDHPSRALAEELAALDRVHLDGLPLDGAKRVYGYHHALQVADVLDAIRAGRRPLVGFADAAQANACVLAAYHSAATGAPSPVPPPAEAYRFPDLAAGGGRPPTPQEHP